MFAIEVGSLGNVTKYEYDKTGRCISTELAMGQRSETVYDEVCIAIKTTDFNGNVTEYNYDKAGYLLSKKTTNNTVIFNYDNKGRVESVVDKA